MRHLSPRSGRTPIPVPTASRDQGLPDTPIHGPNAPVLPSRRPTRRQTNRRHLEERVVRRRRRWAVQPMASWSGMFMFHGRPPRPTRRRRRWSAHLRAARRSRSQKASPAPQGQCSEDLHDSLFGRNLGDGDGPHVPLVGVDPMILEAAAAPIAVRQRPAGGQRAMPPRALY